MRDPRTGQSRSLPPGHPLPSSLYLLLASGFRLLRIACKQAPTFQLLPFLLPSPFSRPRMPPLTSTVSSNPAPGAQPGAPRRWRQVQRRILPGFGLTLGFALTYLSVIILLPLAATFLKTAELSWAEFWAHVSAPRALASYRVTFGTSFFAALVNVPCGLILAWVLVRYQFPGRRIIDALVDLPFALPTAVAGIALTAIYAPTGWIGELLAPLGIKVAYTPLGIWVALTFIGLPFVVRTVQPIMEELEPELEEAAATLGASRLQTIGSVVIPALLPAIVTGFALAFARAIGEYGSVVFIAGNMPMRTEITPLLIVTKLEQYDYAGATALAVVMLVVSFLLLLFIQLSQRFFLRGARTR
jgi:sulfate/thiosulfate transport system permease protein